MPRNAFLGMPRIWFSLRSLNKRKRGTKLTTGRLCLHLITLTKPRAGGRGPLGGLFSLRPRAATSLRIVPSRDGLCLNGYQGEPLASRAGSVGGLAPPGQEPKPLGYLLHTLHPTLCFATSQGPSPAPPPARIPPPSQGQHLSSSPLSGGPPAAPVGGVGMELASCLSDGGRPSLSLSVSGASRVISVTGMMDSNCISIQPPRVGGPVGTSARIRQC